MGQPPVSRWKNRSQMAPHRLCATQDLDRAIQKLSITDIPEAVEYTFG